MLAYIQTLATIIISIFALVLFSPMVSGWKDGRREEVCPACVSETVSCRKLILGRDRLGGVGVQRHGVTFL